MLHAHHASQGHQCIIIPATDTDVLVLTIAVASILVGCEKAWAMLLFHAIASCDTVAAMFDIGKKMAWNVWCSQCHLIPIFSRLSRAPKEIKEIFVVLMYSQTSELSKLMMYVCLLVATIC